jgi:hypothetical protein
MMNTIGMGQGQCSSDWRLMVSSDRFLKAATPRYLWAACLPTPKSENETFIPEGNAASKDGAQMK